MKVLPVWFGWTLVLSACSWSTADLGYEPCTYMGRSRGCATVPLAREELNSLAKQFQAPPPDKARLYIVRSTLTSRTNRSDVVIDGTKVTSLAPMTFVVLDMVPGAYAVLAHTRASQVTETVSLVSGKVYFLQYDPGNDMDLLNGRLVLLADGAGKAEVGKSRLVYTESERK